MIESDILEEEESILEEEVILEEESILEEEEELILDIHTLAACFSTPSGVRTFGIDRDGPTLAQDAEREVMDTVIGMPDPRVLETHELDKIEDHRLDPRPYHKDFAEFLQMQQDRICAGAIDDGREVAVGSFMSPDSVLRVLSGLAPTDVFGLLDSDAPEVVPEVEESREVVSEPVSSRVVRAQAVAV